MDRCGIGHDGKRNVLVNIVEWQMCTVALLTFSMRRNGNLFRLHVN